MLTLMVRGKNQKNDPPRSIRLGPDLERRLDGFRERHYGVSRTCIVRKAIERFLDEEEAKS